MTRTWYRQDKQVWHSSEVLNLANSLNVLSWFHFCIWLSELTPPVFTNLYHTSMSGLHYCFTSELKIILSSQMFLSQLCNWILHTHQCVSGFMKDKFSHCRLNTLLFQVFCCTWTKVFARTPASEAPIALCSWKEKVQNGTWNGASQLLKVMEASTFFTCNLSTSLMSSS